MLTSHPLRPTKTFLSRFPAKPLRSLLMLLATGVSVTLHGQQRVTGLILIDASTDREIRMLAPADTIDPAADGTSVAIRADTDPATVGSVVFELDGSAVRTENVAPYSMGGDNSGDYNPVDLTPGNHRVKAIPFTESGGSGTEGTALTTDLFVPAGPAIPGGPATPPADPGTGTVEVTGELKQWHKVTLHVDGPLCDESDLDPNPFLDLRLIALFTKDSLAYPVPGYFAGDGNAAHSGATSGSTWRVHFAPPDTGIWNYSLSMRLGRNVAVRDSAEAGEPLAPVDGVEGTLQIASSDKSGRDLRAHGLLQYVGEHYLRFAGNGEYFLKQGADAPENFLAYEDFDGSFKNDGIKDNLVKDWAPHVDDWKEGDPTWAGGKGKGIIGAINYLASEGMNAFSFLTMNIGGDDRNVFPYTGYSERTHMDVSRLDQWEIVFEHGTRKGMYLHFKTQETENETLLDGGDLGVRRKLYYRELIARYSHHLALNWNLGEEINEQTLKQRQDMAEYFWTHDPYRHHIVIHNGKKPDDMLGDASFLTGFSLQTSQSDFSRVHSSVLEWVNKSADAGKPWVVACDEPGDASHALVPDKDDPTHDNARKNALWGTFMAGGAGNEWYFGYRHDHSDLTCEDFRSRDDWWDQCLIAMDFFREHTPFWEMKNQDALTDGDYCLAKPGEIYVVYLKNGRNHKLELPSGVYDVQWFDPRNGGDLFQGTTTRISGPGSRYLGVPPADDPSGDWTVLVTRNLSGASGSDDATLISLVPGAGTLDPGFYPTDTVYSLALPEGEVRVALTATPADPRATVAGAGTFDASSGSDTAVVAVTSQDGTATRNYRVFISAVPLSTDATLSGLAASAGSLEPDFDPGVTHYTLTLPPGSVSVHITAAPNDPDASVSGTGYIDVSNGSATAEIVVTAEDGSTVRSYVVEITVRPSSSVSGTSAQIFLYPNPASSTVRIQGTDPADKIRVIGPLGQVVLSPAIPGNSVELDVSGLKGGMYVVSLERAGVSFTLPLTVRR